MDFVREHRVPGDRRATTFVARAVTILAALLCLVPVVTANAGREDKPNPPRKDRPWKGLGPARGAPGKDGGPRVVFFSSQQALDSTLTDLNIDPDHTWTSSFFGF